MHTHTLLTHRYHPWSLLAYFTQPNHFDSCQPLCQPLFRPLCHVPTPPPQDALVYSNNDWVDSDVAELCTLLEGGELNACKSLWLSQNDITDEGMRMLAACLGGGALPALEQVHLHGNSQAGSESREKIRAARPELQVHYDGMGGARTNHAV